MSTLKEFTIERLRITGRNAFEAAKIADAERNFVHDILIDKKKSVRGSSIQSLAIALDTSAEAIVAAMSGKRSAATPGTTLSASSTVKPADLGEIIPISVSGKVEAGAFRSIEDLGDHDDPEIFYDSRDRRFPDARHLGFAVEGDSMNALKPRPIMPGDRLSALAYEDIDERLPLRDGMIVVVERSRYDGQEREWSVKQLELYEDRVEFHPRSTNPRHKPIVVPRDNLADDGTKVEIIAIVRRAVAEFNL